jgi:hypothetical protein
MHHTTTKNMGRKEKHILRIEKSLQKIELEFSNWDGLVGLPSGHFPMQKKYT